MKIKEVPFSDLRTADLYIDTIYKGGSSGNKSDEVISKVMNVENSKGFRKRYITDHRGKRTTNLAYVCIHSTGEEIEWQDTMDRTLGRFTYYGDNRIAGNPILQTDGGGNRVLQTIFSDLSLGLRKQIPPIFVFQKCCGWDEMFLGLAVPGDRRINPQDALVALWAQNNQGRYQNYRAQFTILDVPEIDRRWLEDLRRGAGFQSVYAPPVWKKWVTTGEYTPLITEKNPIKYRRANEQLPASGTNEYKMLEALIDYFPKSKATDFEKCACKIVQIMDSNIIHIETTRATKDGGRDGIGKYRIGTVSSGIELEFFLEAKAYQMKNAVGVKATSRLISRIKHREFGILVTTSYVGDQAYKEIIEDGHPILIISGKDIIDILMRAGINDVQTLKDWLTANF